MIFYGVGRQTSYQLIWWKVITLVHWHLQRRKISKCVASGKVWKNKEGRATHSPDVLRKHELLHFTPISCEVAVLTVRTFRSVSVSAFHPVKWPLPSPPFSWQKFPPCKYPRATGYLTHISSKRTQRVVILLIFYKIR